MRILKLFLVLLLVISFGCSSTIGKRTSHTLNGEWQLAVTGIPEETPSPEDYTFVVPVPGLVDLATPRMNPVELEDRIYWYKRNFKTQEAPYEVCFLKINTTC